MSDYISKSALIESIKAEIQCVEKEKQQYFEQGNFHNGNIIVEKIQAMKLVMKIVANQSTLDEKEIIRKPMERILTRLEEEKIEMYKEWLQTSHFQDKGEYLAYKHATEICKEEGGIE